MFVKYFESLHKLSLDLKVTDQDGNDIGPDKAFSLSVTLFRSLEGSKNKMMFIGNGGSAGIASHQSTDYSKNGRIRAMAFNDASLLTCLSNDFGYEKIFEEAVRIHAESGDILIAISSSGESPNIINGAKKAIELGCHVITLSGFKDANPLRKMGHINYYVPSTSYGYVEISHIAILHSLLDHMMGLTF